MGLGFRLIFSSNNIITKNTLNGFHVAAIEFLGSSNNLIYQNNFIYNGSLPLKPNNTAPTVADDYDDPNILSIYPSLTLSVNLWDYEGAGNFWSDYATRYPNAKEIGNLGTGDTPYVINAVNQDNHPLTSPINTAASSQPETSATVNVLWHL